MLGLDVISVQCNNEGKINGLVAQESCNSLNKRHIVRYAIWA